MPSAMVSSSRFRADLLANLDVVPSMRMTTDVQLQILGSGDDAGGENVQRKMPPKILMKRFDFGSLMRMRKAFLNLSEEAPPPTSEKLAEAAGT